MRQTRETPLGDGTDWPPHVTGDEIVAAMDKVGVDGAVFISAFSMYRYDDSYAKEVQQAHPGRMAIVKPVDPDKEGVADVVADWKRRRVRSASASCSRRSTARAGRCGLRPHRARPSSTTCRSTCVLGRPRQRQTLIDRHPDTRFIIDHLAILQPRIRPRRTGPGRPAEGAGVGGSADWPSRSAGTCTLSKDRISTTTLGSAPAHLRRMGLRALSLGHGLDARGRGRQLRAGR